MGLVDQAQTVSVEVVLLAAHIQGHDESPGREHVADALECQASWPYSGVGIVKHERRDVDLSKCAVDLVLSVLNKLSRNQPTGERNVPDEQVRDLAVSQLL